MRNLYYLFLSILIVGCGGHWFGYRNFVGPVRPVPDEQQGKEMRVSDDGTVTYVQERLEIGIQPVSDTELNATFAAASKGAVTSTNPYTFGDWTPPGEEETPSRFTVIRLKVKNYQFPKMSVDPLKAEIVTSNGRWYKPFNITELENYFYRYSIGYAGLEDTRFERRKDILKQTMYEDVPIFSGQEKEGYMLFPHLHDDITAFSVHLKDVVLEFDYRNEPIKTIGNLVFNFQREVYKARQPRREMR